MQVSLDHAEIADAPKVDQERHDSTHEIRPDIAYKRLALVNVVFQGWPGAGNRQWVLIDAGIPGMADSIIAAADNRFCEDARPAAIILTHGHFDHAGSLETLAARWDVPVYAHLLEFPYLNGTASYPPPDSDVGGGIMSLLSPLFPRGPVNVSPWLKALPENGHVPFMDGWIWIHTPGHSPGHVSFWRERDRTLIAGDAFITTAQESAYAVATQHPEMHGPPMFYTQNWDDARESVRKLSALLPEYVITGHGPAMRGAETREALHMLADHFDEIAVPKDGYYVKHPASIKDGSAYKT
ncbi:MAG TPA: MBL fold metallo-hydrolase [Planctomycetota bacterium]|nr:MBL fold metallo-hydrolase [Planctomycetota bacterium]